MSDGAAKGFNPLDWPQSLAEPEHLSEISAWHGHIPFAFFAVAALRPRLTVELGTHKGDSYMALCQAMVAQGLEGSQAFAVDTWTGDAHSRAYDTSQVLGALREQHDPRYGHFSTLLPMTFDEARPRFAPGTIDLLHIDGLHTYEAVAHDVATWLDALSPRGVLLLHDTHERSGDFGVWRLWDELKAQYPYLDCSHSHGLGVLLVGPEVPEPLAAMGRADDATKARITSWFATLGERVRTLGEQRRKLAGLEQAGREAAEQAEHLEQRLAELEASASAHERELAACRDARDAARADLAAATGSWGWRLADSVNRLRRKLTGR